jgi:hypothetical protein
MTTSAWTWAALNGAQLKMVSEAEQTLGDNVNYILAFQPGKEAGIMGFIQNARSNACRGSRRSSRQL